MDKVNLAVAYATGKHGPAAYNNGRYVQAQCSHEHAGDDFIAVGYQHQAVKRMGHSHNLDRVGNKLTAGKGVLHAFVVHGYAIANADG